MCGTQQALGAEGTKTERNTMIKKNRFMLLLLLYMMGCAGWGRQCSSCTAESFGADWIVLQYGMDGKPINCWVLEDTSIDNEGASDGIYWLDRNEGHLVHISGWYNRVQLGSGKNSKETAAKLLGIDLKQCVNGRYGAGP